MSPPEPTEKKREELRPKRFSTFYNVTTFVLVNDCDRCNVIPQLGSGWHW